MYVIAETIKTLRSEKNMTQGELADKLRVSPKTISKWETGRGLPDISMLAPLSEVLGVSVNELMKGESVRNTNLSCNMRKLKIYVCPICGNVIVSPGEAAISCCGVDLLPQEAEEADEMHEVKVERVEDEYYVSSDHEMSKEHYLSFFLALKDNAYEMVKLYPEGMAEARFKIARTKYIYYYCNRDGLFNVKVR